MRPRSKPFQAHLFLSRTKGPAPKSCQLWMCFLVNKVSGPPQAPPEAPRRRRKIFGVFERFQSNLLHTIYTCSPTR